MMKNIEMSCLTNLVVEIKYVHKKYHVTFKSIAGIFLENKFKGGKLRLSKI